MGWHMGRRLQRQLRADETAVPAAVEVAVSPRAWQAYATQRSDVNQKQQVNNQPVTLAARPGPGSVHGVHFSAALQLCSSRRGPVCMCSSS